eukprot:scaffold63147_cov81-Phaeocystis_antarctica.AAC.1
MNCHAGLCVGRRNGVAVSHQPASAASPARQVLRAPPPIPRSSSRCIREATGARTYSSRSDPIRLRTSQPRTAACRRRAAAEGVTVRSATATVAASIRSQAGTALLSKAR